MSEVHVDLSKEVALISKLSTVNQNEIITTALHNITIQLARQSEQITQILLQQEAMRTDINSLKMRADAR